MAAPRTSDEFARSLPRAGYDEYSRAFQAALAEGATTEQAAAAGAKAAEIVTPKVKPPPSNKIVVTPSGEAKEVPVGADINKPYAEQVKDQPSLSSTDLYNIGFQTGQRNLPGIIERIKKDNVIIGDYRIPIKSWNQLPDKYKSIALKDGLDAMNKAMEKDENAAHWLEPQNYPRYKVTETTEAPPAPVARYKNVSNGQFITEAEYKKLGHKAEKDLYIKETLPLISQLPKKEGPTEYQHTLTGAKISEAKYKSMRGAEKDMYRLSLESGKGKLVKEGITLAADIAIPGFYVGRNWKSLSSAEQAIYLGLDMVLFAYPAYKAAIRGARSAGALTRLGTLKGAAAGASREILAQLAGPVNLIVHPVESAKAAVKSAQDVTEYLTDLNKLPEVVVTTSHSTARLPVSKFKSEAEAKAVRDKIMALAKESGARVTVEAGDLVIEVERSSLMKALKGGLAHATPTGEKFVAELAEKGIITVKYKPGLSAKEQGLYFSHEPLSRFVEATARGKTGQMKLYYIVSPETANKIGSSNKLYKSPKELVAELESVAGINTQFKAPKQKLYTRLYSTGERVEIWLEKPLSKIELARLKVAGITDSIKALYTPAVRIKNIRMAKQEFNGLIKTLEKSGNRSAARSLRQLERIAAERGGGRVAAAIAARRITKTTTRTNPPTIRRRVRVVEEREILPRKKVKATRATRTTTTTRAVTPARVPPTREPPARVPPPREPPRVPPREPPRVPPREPPRVPPREPPRVPPREPPRVPPRKGSTDKKSLTPEEIKSAVAFRMGSLGRGETKKPVTIAIIPPDRKVVFVGKTPEGMKVAGGPGQLKPKQTVQLIRGKGGADITGRQGFASFNISDVKRTPGAGKMTFGAPTYKTTGKGKIKKIQLPGGTGYIRRD